jgi:hypothetical protein
MRTILVTGGNRMGTSWMGKMLCLSGEAFLVWEPFNHLTPMCRIFPEHPLDHHYQRILPEQVPLMRAHIRNRCIMDVVHGAEGGRTLPGRLKKIANVIRRTALVASGRMIPLLKDPIGLMSAEWIAQEYDAAVIIMVRHPAAYVNSVRRLNWRTPVEDFLRQDHLMSDLPLPLQSEIRERASSRPEPDSFVLEDAALCWKVFHTVVDSYRKDHPDWLFIRHEDISRNYLQGFEEIYGTLDLTWSAGVAERIDSLCSNRNPVKQGESIHEFRQDSASLTEVWKNNFNKDEVETIRRITSPLWQMFYDEASWTAGK